MSHPFYYNMELSCRLQQQLGLLIVNPWDMWITYENNIIAFGDSVRNKKGPEVGLVLVSPENV